MTDAPLPIRKLVSRRLFLFLRFRVRYFLLIANSRINIARQQDAASIAGGEREPARSFDHGGDSVARGSGLSRDFTCHTAHTSADVAGRGGGPA